MEFRETESDLASDEALTLTEFSDRVPNDYETELYSGGVAYNQETELSSDIDGYSGGDPDDREAELSSDGNCSDQAEILSAHIERLWNQLDEQSQKRLECLAVSAGVSVTVDDHAALCGAFEMIAEEEGVLESEAEFASVYLGVQAICQWVAKRPSSLSERMERDSKRPSSLSESLAKSMRPSSLSESAAINAKRPSSLSESATSLSDVSRPSKRPSSLSDGLGRLINGRPPSPIPKDQRNREAVARHREKKRSEARAKELKAQLKAEARLGKVRELAAIAIDGEGVSLDDGSHVYRYMAACLSDGTCLGELYNESGITTREVLDFICGLPKHDDEGKPYLGVFGYGLGYDQTKWLEGLKNKELYDLFHAEDLEAKAKVGPYRLNLLGKCLQITNKKGKEGQKRTLVWDILKAFQATFVNALKTWKVGTLEEWQQIEDMKKQRGKFAHVTWSDVTAYCRDECRLLAALVEKYVRAHCDAGIDLRGKYHGAGSTGDAFLTLMDAQNKRCTGNFEKEDQLNWRKAKSAFSRAFFGGRAEVSRLGIVEGPVYNYDIGSAYPHALYSLPCVRHGSWKHMTSGVDKAIERSRLACVHYTFYGDLSAHDSDVEDDRIAERASLMGIFGKASTMPWGPLPYRTAKASIVFPCSSPGGWAWREEYKTAERLWPDVIARDAWCLRSECQCEPPYRQIGEYYLKRLEWGKEGPGLVLKLGLNSCYGKFAQVIGNNPKYACRVVAGVITSTTRARIIEAIASAKDPWDVVYVATDGIITNAPIDPPDPAPNATKEDAERKGKVMLGAWEKSEPIKDTYFVVQPGFYFSTQDGGKAKTRGMPLEVVNSERGKILEQWRREPLEPPKGLPSRSMFRGVKTSILKPTKEHSTYRRKSCYGKWETEEREIKYVINPKRSHPEPLRGGEAYRLLSWKLFPNQEESAEYAKDKGHDEAREWMDEQPDFVETPGTNVGD